MINTKEKSNGARYGKLIESTNAADMEAPECPEGNEYWQSGGLHTR
jgi:hypothetical protein